MDSDEKEGKVSESISAFFDIDSVDENADVLLSVFFASESVEKKIDAVIFRLMTVKNVFFNMKIAAKESISPCITDETVNMIIGQFDEELMSGENKEILCQCLNSLSILIDSFEHAEKENRESSD